MQTFTTSEATQAHETRKTRKLLLISKNCLQNGRQFSFSSKAAYKFANLPA